jgi:hypothetical protein
MHTDDVTGALAKFDLFLAKPDSYRLHQCSLITSTKIRYSYLIYSKSFMTFSEKIIARTMENVIGAYSIIYAKIINPSNKYPQMALKTVDQVCWKYNYKPLLFFYCFRLRNYSIDAQLFNLLKHMKIKLFWH